MTYKYVCVKGLLRYEWLSRYGLLENCNASVMHTETGTGTGTTGVTAIALCTSCSRAKNWTKCGEKWKFYVKMGSERPSNVLYKIFGTPKVAISNNGGRFRY